MHPFALPAAVVVLLPITAGGPHRRAVPAWPCASSTAPAASTPTSSPTATCSQ